MTSARSGRTVLSMAGGGRSISLQSASWSALTLQFSAVLLGLLAALCWFWASLSPLQTQSVGGDGFDLRWWSAWVAALGIGVGLLTWFAATVRGRTGLVVIAALLVLITVGVVWFFRVVVPNANPIHPISSAVPYGMVGFGAAAAACLVTLLSIALSGGWSAPSPQTRPAMRSPAGVAAAVAALLLVAAAGLVGVDRSHDYLLRANEYRTDGDVHGAPATVPPSTLSGGTRWQVGVPGLSLARPAVTDYGIGLTSGQNVIMVDPATGGIRWRYTRSDVTGTVSVASTGGGEQVLAWWGPEAVYVLDARTGERVGHWDTTGAEISILEPALPVVSWTGPDDRTTLARLSPTGSAVWTYPLGTCERARATLAEATVVVTVATICGTTSSRMVALDSESGHELWTADTEGDVRAVADGTVIVLTPAGGETPAGSLTAIDLDDGTARWTHELPHHKKHALACADALVEAAGQVAALACNWDLTDYATVGVQQASAVFIYDLVSGSSLRTIAYRTAPITFTTAFPDGRVLVALVDGQQTWMLDLTKSNGSRHSVSIAPYAGSHSTVRDLRVSGDQVLVIDAGSETLSCLR